jgi:cysteine desulfurase
MTLALEKRTASAEEDTAAARELKRILVEGISGISGARIFPSAEEALGASYSPWIVSASFPPLPGEVLARVMDDNGVALSTGSACSSRKKNQSRVLQAQGVDEKRAFSTLRLSWGPDSTREDALRVINLLKEQTALLGRFQGSGRR